LGSIKAGEFHDQLDDYKILRKESVLALHCKKLFYIDQYPAILLLFGTCKFGLAPSVKQHFLTHIIQGNCSVRMSQSLTKGLSLKQKMKNINIPRLSPVNKFKHLITNKLKNSFFIYTYMHIVHSKFSKEYEMNQRDTVKRILGPVLLLIL
jgi:hypothetical protein